MIKIDKNEEKLFNFALQLLANRQHSCAELRNKLLRKPFGTGEAVTKVIERLEKLKLLDDLTFAREWVRYRSERSPRGKLFLTFELRRKGISREIIDHVFEDNDFEENLLAKEALRKKFDYLREKSSDKIQNKLFSFLKNRGFNSSTIINSVRDFLAKS